MEANSSRRKRVCSVADRCGPLFNAAWRSPSVQLPDISTTGAPRCFYCRNKCRSGCFTSAKEAKSPLPRCLRTNSVQPSLVTSLASHATYLSMLSGSWACLGRGMRVGRLEAGYYVLFFNSQIKMILQSLGTKTFYCLLVVLIVTFAPIYFHLSLPAILVL